MQVVIDIPEEEYNTARFMGFIHKDIIFEAIKNSIPLPKGHGRLVDINTLDDTVMRLNEDEDGHITRNDYKIIDVVLFEMPTVIEADKEVSE